MSNYWDTEKAVKEAEDSFSRFIRKTLSKAIEKMVICPTCGYYDPKTLWYLSWDAEVSKKAVHDSMCDGNTFKTIKEIVDENREMREKLNDRG